MLKSRSKFALHATVRRVGTDDESFDDARAGHPLERRLNRIERVAAAYRGKIDLRFNDGMLVTFEDADSALLGACEMQHRCAVLPQPSRQKIALNIGIHQGVYKQRAKDSADATGELAAQLARIDDGILISQSLLDGLNQELNKLTRPLGETVAGLAVHTVDWRRELPSGAYGGESFWPTSMHSLPTPPYLTLQFGLKTLEISEHNPIATIGRDPQCDLVLNDIHVSRRHCRIERTLKGIVLNDLSTNGTCIVSDDGTEHVVRNGSTVLKGRGLLFPGRPFKGERRGGVKFEVS